MVDGIVDVDLGWIGGMGMEICFCSAGPWRVLGPGMGMSCMYGHGAYMVEMRWL